MLESEEQQPQNAAEGENIQIIIKAQQNNENGEQAEEQKREDDVVNIHEGGSRELSEYDGGELEFAEVYVVKDLQRSLDLLVC